MEALQKAEFEPGARAAQALGAWPQAVALHVAVAALVAEAGAASVAAAACPAVARTGVAAALVEERVAEIEVDLSEALAEQEVFAQAVVVLFDRLSRPSLAAGHGASPSRQG